MEQELKIEKMMKLLALTTSSNDNEALSAIRKVNSFLAETNMTWPELFEAKSSKELADVKNKYNQLVQKFNELVMRLRTPTPQVVVVPQRMPSYRPYRRRSRRL